MSLHVAADFIQPDRFVPLTDLALQVLPGEHPFVAEHRETIARHWQAETEANPHLFNGSVALQRRVWLEDGVLSAEANMGPYAALLSWRRMGRPQGLTHLFAMALVISSDERLLAIRMAPHTANPGQIYCPAGSLDAGDVVDGQLDASGNMAREVAEETGLDLAMAEVDPGFHAAFQDNTVILTRRYRMPTHSSLLVDQVLAHMAVDQEKEIDAVMTIGRHDAANPAYSRFMPAILAHVFA